MGYDRNVCRFLTPETRSLQGYRHMLRSDGRCEQWCGRGLREHGVLFDIGGGVLTYDTRAFPMASRSPRAGRISGCEPFPGRVASEWYALVGLDRSLARRRRAGSATFPLDLDRAFRKMDTIKSSVTVVAQRRPEPAAFPQPGSRYGHDVFGARKPAASGRSAA
jgi:hypothetical protein